MLRVAPLSHQQAAILAVGALDNLVTDLVATSRARLPSDFLDWIADEATPLVERRIFECFPQQAFAQRLHRSDPRIALAGIVREWVAPSMQARFAPLAARLHQGASAAVAIDAPPSASARLPSQVGDQHPVVPAPRSWRIPRPGHAGLRIEVTAPLG